MYAFVQAVAEHESDVQMSPSSQVPVVELQKPAAQLA